MKTKETAPMAREKCLKVVNGDNGFVASIIRSSRDGANFCRNFYGCDIEIYESFFLILLNRMNRTTGYVKISQGGTAGTVVDIKIVCKYAVDSLASGVIVCHNHPSGNLQPRDKDINLIKKLKDALALFDITLLDSLILTSDDYFSFADNGLM